jgi:lysylphosphatidylglycerol synthetase-like protein (DUF2156 family)
MLCVWICSQRAFRGCLYESIVKLYHIKPTNKVNLYKILVQSILMHAISCLHIFPGLFLLLKFRIFLSTFKRLCIVLFIVVISLVIVLSVIKRIDMDVFLDPQEFCSQRESIQKQRI